ncbi:MAG: twin-arginine translocase TatA/TatE family subunit, partial [Thermoleophilia bacterium]|nr:twin-arginine translocase TatA/TatE family subunit [Thermoleophilia bacterium]
VLGPGKLPEVGSAIGKSIREFRRAASDVKEAASVEPAKISTAPAEAPRVAAPSGETPAATAAAQPEPVAAAPVASDTDSPAR